MDTEAIDRDQAILICREVENIIIPLGYHCALGGGCLHQDGKRKDVDILIYPHDIHARNQPHGDIVKMLHGKLSMSGYSEKASTTDKDVFVGYWDSKFRVDLFFLSK